MIATLLRIVLFCIFVSCINCATGSNSSWSYQSQDEWFRRNPECGGQRQSPINIDSSKARPNRRLEIDFHRYRQNIRAYNVTNTGRSIEFTFLGDPEDAPAISGSALNDQLYTLEQFHFHWGQKRGIGSEHTLDGVRFDMELHLVHYNRERYRSLQQALQSHKGVVVLAVLFEIHRQPRDRFTPLVQTVEKMIDFAMNTTTSLKLPLKLIDFMPQVERAESNEDADSSAQFYQYQGSLTTPPCTEGITWLIMTQPVAIGQRQIEVFRAMKNFYHRTEGNNYRRLQKMNGRKVQVSAV